MMNTITTRDISDILSLVPIEIQIRQRDKDTSKTRDMLSYVNYKLQTDNNFHVNIVYDEGEVVGYMMFNICMIPGNRKLDIHRFWYANPEALNELNTLQSMIIKEFKLRVISMLVPWDMQKTVRDWGFKRKSIQMEKEVRR